MADVDKLYNELESGDVKYVSESGLIRGSDGGAWIDRGATLSSEEPKSGTGGAEIRVENGRYRVTTFDGGWEVREGPNPKDRGAWARIEPDNVTAGGGKAKGKAESAEKSAAKTDAPASDPAKTQPMSKPTPAPHAKDDDFGKAHTKAKDPR